MSMQLMELLPVNYVCNCFLFIAEKKLTDLLTLPVGRFAVSQLIVHVSKRQVSYHKSSGGGGELRPSSYL